MRSVPPSTQDFTALAMLALADAGVRLPASLTAAGSCSLAGSAAAAGETPAPVPAPVPKPCATWLAELALLYGVPFDYLVPTAEMLPAESIRFFHLDFNYINQLISGAASVGLGSTLELLSLYGRVQELVWQTVDEMTKVRSRRTGQPEQSSTTAFDRITGFLLRSSVVSGWPGLEASATDKDANALRILRLERLSPDVLICLIAGDPVSVMIRQPTESLHFGVIRSKEAQPLATLRYLQGNQIGSQINEDTAVLTVRGGSKATGVLNVAASAKVLSDRLRAAGQLPDQQLTSAGFAIEMVQSAGLQEFKPQPLSGSPR